MSEKILSWLLRLPMLFILEFMYHKEIPQLLKKYAFMQHELVNNLGLDIDILTSCVQYGFLVAIVLITLPVHHLKSLYIHMITFILLMASVRWSKDYITTSSPDSDRQNIYKEDDASIMPRMIVYLMKQVVLVMTCIWLMSTNRNWIFTAFMPIVPTIIVPTFGLEPNIAENIHVVSSGFIKVVMLSYLVCSIPSLLDLAGQGLMQIHRMTEQGDAESQLMAIYRKTYLPSMFVCLWVCLFIFHNYISYKKSNPFNNMLFDCVSIIADSFGSIWGLIGLCYVVSHTACYIYSGCKIYLVGFNEDLENDYNMSGTTEGIIIIVLALQSGFLSYNRVDKVVNLSVYLFIVASFIIRNFSDMTNSQLLLLGTGYKNILAHLRVLVPVFITLCTPIAMAYYLTQVVIVNHWILFTSLYCVLTSIQNLCSLGIYILFMMDNFREEPFENIDEAVYYIHGIDHVLKFVVSFCQVCLTVYYFSNLNYLGVCILLLNFYFNVWVNAKSGWESFRQKRLVMRKINLLRHATEDELKLLNDVCSICYQNMTTARVTPCGHYFHEACLKKYLYTYASNAKCPMCNSSQLH